MEKRTPILITLALIAIGTLIAVLIWKWDFLVERVSEDRVVAERQAWMERSRELEEIIARMQEGEEPESLLPVERLSQAFGPDSPLVKGASPQTLKCPELKQSLHAYCRYLDTSETMRKHKTNLDSWSLLTDIFTTLEGRLPTIGGESYQPLIIIENSFYFFRLLQKKKSDLVRAVLRDEADLSEPLMGILYHWIMSGRQCETTKASLSALETMYYYAGFFLNTLGGHSYLCRRDSRIRLLTLYYAILVIHEANQHNLNELGLDLRFFLPLVFNEIQNRKDLLYTEGYLQTLSDLQLHYFRQG